MVRYSSEKEQEQFLKLAYSQEVQDEVKVDFKQTWTKESVQEELLSLPLFEGGLDDKTVRARRKGLHMACVRIFGSVEGAVNSVGLPYHRHAPYGDMLNTSSKSTQRIMKTLEQLASEGQCMHPTCLRANGHTSLVNAIMRKFDSFEEVVKPYDLDHPCPKAKAHREPWTEERVLAELRLLSEQGEPLGARYLMANHRALYDAASRFFGTCKKAVNRMKEENLSSDK